jgi:diguanylate cyclase (GGDEF)-like protein/PAS domain S-box-containing protein
MGREPGRVAAEQTSTPREAEPAGFFAADERTLVDLAPAGLSYSDTEGRVVFANQRWREISGCRDEFPISLDRTLELIHPDDRPDTLVAFTAAAEGGEASVHVRPASDHSRQFALAVRYVPASVDPHVRFVTILSDVTALATAMDDARRNEERFRAVTAALPSGVFRSDRDGNIVWANSYMEEMSGYRLGELAGTSAFGLIHPDDRDEAFLRASEALMRKEPFESTHRLVSRDGSVRWVIARSSPIYDEKGTIIEHVGSLEDVTELHLRSEGLAHRAAHDQLTGLPNRAYVTSLVAALADEQPGRDDIGIVFIDLDRFKEVNDTWGHKAGDEVLVEVARRLSQVTRQDDIAGRYGGDEFVVVCQGVCDPAVLEQVATRVRTAIAERPVSAGERTHAIGASVGVAIGPGRGTVDELFHRADEAMYAAKRRTDGDVGG